MPQEIVDKQVSYFLLPLGEGQGEGAKPFLFPLPLGEGQGEGAKRREKRRKVWERFAVLGNPSPHPLPKGEGVWKGATLTTDNVFAHSCRTK